MKPNTPTEQKHSLRDHEFLTVSPYYDDYQQDPKSFFGDIRKHIGLLPDTNLLTEANHEDIYLPGFWVKENGQGERYTLTRDTNQKDRLVFKRMDHSSIASPKKYPTTSEQAKNNRAVWKRIANSEAAD